MDCLEGMKKMGDNTVSAIVTDPPYGLEFMGKSWDKGVPGHEFWEDMLRVAKPGAYLMAFAGTRTQHRMGVNIEDSGWQMRDTLMWMYGSGFPKSYNISKGLDGIIGKQSVGFNTAGYDGRKAEFKQDKSFSAYYGYKWEPSTPEAKLWDGYGTGLKPAYEPIILAQKPRDKTFVNNALTYECGGLNIGRCRISHNEPLKVTNRTPRIEDNIFSDDSCGFKKEVNHIASASQEGRFPANILLDEEAGRMLDEQSGISKSAVGLRKAVNTENNGWKERKGIFTPGREISWIGKGDKGGASRFFYCAKASKSERNLGCGDITNNHCTVKPLKLMEYLIKLIKQPEHNLILDPFAGSGTTLMACKKLGCEYIGFELDKDYCEIANKRVGAINA